MENTIEEIYIAREKSIQNLLDTQDEKYHEDIRSFYNMSIRGGKSIMVWHFQESVLKEIVKDPKREGEIISNAMQGLSDRENKPFYTNQK